ncbi:MAG: hypothetical protein ACYDBB_05540 [Armatimonadota bacterium]
MAERTPEEMSPQEARQRLDELREKEQRDELTVHEAGEITKLLVVLGEQQEKKGEQAA